MSIAPLTPRLRLVGNALTVLGVLPWVTSLLVAGAVVAPLVFGILGDPTVAGSVMQPVFLRLDALYLTATGLLLAGEAAHAVALRGEVFAWKHLLRLPLAVAMAAMATYGALFVHPEMKAIRDAGMTRGQGESWIRFESLHRLSESLGKTEVALGLLLLALVFAGAWSRTAKET